MNQPAFQGIDVVYKGKADNKDIRDLLEKLVPKASEQMKGYAQKFKGKTELQTCKNIFNFLKNDLTKGAQKSQSRVIQDALVPHL
jgi:hypothetical protein